MTQVDPRITALLAKENWHEERKALRAVALESGLQEAVKWGNLCFCLEGRNVAILYAMKATVGLSFFKGVLMRDPKGLLVQQGKHSQAGRLLGFTSLAQIRAQEDDIKAMIAEAIAVERSGRKVDFAEKDALVYPPELIERLAQDSALNAAFEALTPGRKRGYVLHFEGAKQAATRHARIDKYAPKIMAGKGMNDWK